jgi:hypothetical protein
MTLEATIQNLVKIGAVKSPGAMKPLFTSG